VRKTTLICDRCKYEETGENEYTIKNSGWNDISIHQCSRSLKSYLLCPKCSEQLGLIEATAKPTMNECHTLADRLIECITEIVAEQMQG
jgi:hypothetical protein